MREAGWKKKKLKRHPLSQEKRKERAILGAQNKWKIYLTKQKLKEEVLHEIKEKCELITKEEQSENCRFAIKLPLRRPTQEMGQTSRNMANTLNDMRKRYNFRGSSKNISEQIFHFKRCHFCDKERKATIFLKCTKCSLYFCQICYTRMQKNNEVTRTFEEMINSECFECQVCKGLCRCRKCINMKIGEKLSVENRKEEEPPEAPGGYMQIEPYAGLPELKLGGEHNFLVIPRFKVREEGEGMNRREDQTLPKFCVSLSALGLSLTKYKNSPISTGDPISPEVAHMLIDSSTRSIEQIAAYTPYILQKAPDPIYNPMRYTHLPHIPAPSLLYSPQPI